MAFNVKELIKLYPIKSSFYLSSIDKEVCLNPCTLGKIVELESKYGSIEKILSEANLDNMSKVAYSLMTDECKMFFKATKTETTDDDGNVVTGSYGGVKLFQTNIATIEEYKEIVLAVFKSFGMNTEQVEDVKKKMEVEVHPQ